MTTPHQNPCTWTQIKFPSKFILTFFQEFKFNFLKVSHFLFPLSHTNPSNAAIPLFLPLSNCPSVIQSTEPRQKSISSVLSPSCTLSFFFPSSPLFPHYRSKIASPSLKTRLLSYTLEDMSRSYQSELKDINEAVRDFLSPMLPHRKFTTSLCIAQSSRKHYWISWL